MTEGIKKEREAFEVKREELLAEFQEEKKIQQKLINEEVQKYKALQDEELQKIKEKHLKAQKEAEKTHIQSLQGLEKMIVKSREDFQTFQKALKDDADKMKIEANTEMLQVKNRLENATGQLNKEHEQVKKNLAFEIESMVVLKKRVEQELKSLEESRKDKMTRADSEAKELISEAKKQSESIMNKLEAEKEKEKVSLLQLKEKEMAEIEEMKKSALKDIYGKKTERAKDVVTNVIAVMLTELNKVRNKRLSDELIEECTNEVSEIVYNTVMGTASVDKLKFDSAVKERVKAKKGWVELRNQLKMVGIAALGIIFLISLPSLLALPEVAQLKSFISSLLNP